MQTTPKPKKKRKSPLQNGTYELKMICFNGMNIPMLTGSLQECRDRVKRRIAWYRNTYAAANGDVTVIAPGWEWECTQDGLVGDADGYLKIQKVSA